MTGMVNLEAIDELGAGSAYSEWSANVRITDGIRAFTTNHSSGLGL
jgi:hypothetical protein